LGLVAGISGEGKSRSSGQGYGEGKGLGLGSRVSFTVRVGALDWVRVEVSS
jgi:hypothetical protein